MIDEAASGSTAESLDALAGAGDWPSYFEVLSRHLASEAPPSFALLSGAYQDAERAPDDVQGFQRVRVGILRNITVEPWIPELFGAFVQRGLLPRFWLGDFEVFEGYALDPASALHTQDLDVLLVHLDGMALAGDGRILSGKGLEGALLHRITGLISSLLEGWKGQIILSNLAPPPWEYFSPHSHQDRGSWLQQRRALNLALAEQYGGERRVHLLDMDDLVSRFGASRAYDHRMLLTAKMPYRAAFLPILASRVAGIVRALRTPPRKCIVVDCDNTLWGGVLGEDEPGGLALGDTYPGVVFREFQLFLKAMKERGFMLALNSKNNESDVISFIDDSPDMILRMDDFVAYRINWNDKVANFRELAQEINVGLDSMIFIDDSHVECELVASLLPEVRVERFPSSPLAVSPFIESISDTEVLFVTEDDLKRNASYKASAQRERLRRESTDLDGFIRSLQISLSVQKQEPETIQRVSQLTQRTNQFNLTTRRYGVDEIEQLLEHAWVFTMRMADRFTDYGLIGLAIVVPTEDGAAEIDTLLLSCRAFGRKVEEAFLKEILGSLHGSGLGRITGRFLATRKNGMVRDFFADQGFRLVEESEDERVFEIELHDSVGPDPQDDTYNIERRGL